MGDTPPFYSEPRRSLVIVSVMCSVKWYGQFFVTRIGCRAAIDDQISYKIWRFFYGFGFREVYITAML